MRAAIVLTVVTGIDYVVSAVKGSSVDPLICPDSPLGNQSRPPGVAVVLATT